MICVYKGYENSISKYYNIRGIFWKNVSINRKQIVFDRRFMIDKFYKQFTKESRIATKYQKKNKKLEKNKL